jgi:hypothetical protein
MKMEDIADVKLRLTQVKDGVDYKGSISFDGVSFDYKIHFATPINKLDDLIAQATDPEEIRKTIQIDVTDKEGKPVSMESDQNYGLFLATVGRSAVEFYNHPQTRDSNDGPLGMLVRGEGFLGSIGSAELAIQSNMSMQKNPILVEFLNQYRHDEEKTQEE